MKSKLLALVLAAMLLCAAAPLSASAVDIESPEDYAADILYQLGLFHGVGNKPDGSPDYALLGTPSREVAVTMLVRLLGKDAEAQQGSYKTPFTDVSDWAKPYVGYAYTHKLTLGQSATKFGGSAPVIAADYLTFVLRALGYSSESDFSWGAAWDFSDELGITYGEYDASGTNFSRGDVAIISAAALGAPMKDSAGNLLVYLNSSGALAKNNLVLMDLSVVACQKNSIGFAFYPIPGSPNSYTNFVLDSVTVNGLPCKIQQSSSPSAAQAAKKDLNSKYPGVFNYALLSYDEEGAKRAAEHSTNLGGGNVFPVLVFSFEASATRADGTKVKESFSEAVYIDGYGENT